MGIFIQDSIAAETTTAGTTSADVKPGGAPEGDLLGMVLPFVFIFVVFYFLILRPQQRKFKQHQALIAGIRRGDKVVTSGGIIGKVVKVDAEENIIQVEIADDIIVKVMASTISNVITDRPINDNAAEAKADKKIIKKADKK